MREILYRGFHPDENGTQTITLDGKKIKGKWVYGYYVEATCHWHKYGIHNSWIITSALQNGGYFNVIGRYPVILETVGQFTGLTDKNGKKIMTSDILKWDCREWGGEFNEVVRWDYEQLNMRKRDWKEWCEVIGNVYDNPELLNKD